MSLRSFGRGLLQKTWMLAAFALVGCGDPGLIDGDADIVLPDGGLPDVRPGFDDGGGISRTGLALSRVTPDHGSFIGGNQVVLRGSGFTDESLVTFGGLAVQPADHRLIDPRRLAVVVPAGEPGLVDVTVTVGSETVTLEDGYTYDAIHVDPSSGSVSGGTFVSIVGAGTRFQVGDEVIFGRTACEDVEVVSETRINCRTPPMAAGSVDVTVSSPDASRAVSAPDAFTYYNSSDPFAGGLGGGPIAGAINVTVLDAMTGLAVPDAYAIVGEDFGTEHQGLTDSLGQITFSGPDILPPATVHIAKHCYERTSIIAFDARDVTVFLSPWLDLMCGEPGNPGGGGRGRNGAFIEGELVWFTDFGIGPQSWHNVPEPRDDWVRAAYVYTTQATINSRNPDPSAGGSVQRVVETITGEDGYPYSIFARPAGLAVYALAGLEHPRSGRFIPYVMGIARNVLAGPGQVVTGVDIDMNIPLDHYLEAQLTDIPSRGRTGPDRFEVKANIDLAGEGVIVRDVFGVELDVVRARSAGNPLRFLAQPALEGALADGRYRVEAGWVTGDFGGQPYTRIVERGVRAVDDVVVMGGFLGVPQASAPAYGERLPEDRVFRWEADGPDPDLHLVTMTGADGNAAWRMFVPGHVREAPAPDLSSIPGLEDLPGGTLTWRVYAISIPNFDFAELRYSDLNDLYWTRWAVDSFTAQR